MQKIFSPKLKRYVYEIYAGGYWATQEPNVAFSAVLGSCIAVCLKDRVTGIAGMNHFMLPGKPRPGGTAPRGDTRYGSNSMSTLINAMLKIGANKSTLEAKAFGGGQVYKMPLSNVADTNIDFIRAYLETKKIPLLASNMGNRFGRKIYFLPDSFDVYVKRLNIREAAKQWIGPLEC